MQKWWAPFIVCIGRRSWASRMRTLNPKKVELVLSYSQSKDSRIRLCGMWCKSNKYVLLVVNSVLVQMWFAHTVVTR